MTEDTYNGWANYETWAVGMYLDGNYDGPGTYYLTIDTVRDALHNGGTALQVADALKEMVEEYTNPHTIDDDHPDPALHPLVADLFGAALSSVDWHELADAWIENVSEQVA
jgi:hypothetical protein